MRHLIRPLQLAIRHLLELIYPSTCASCEEPAPPGALLCRPCAQSLVPAAGACCPVCALVYLSPPPGSSDHTCGDCLRARPPYVLVRAAYAYGAAVADAVARWKNRPDHTLGPALARLMCAAGAAAGWGADVPRDALVVPIPSHRQALRRRGFNPAGALARAFARRHRLRLRARGLRCARPIPSSRGLGRAARERRVSGAFVASPRALAGRRVVLVDDVMTTGATVRTAARACLRAGAAEVRVFVLARATRG